MSLRDELDRVIHAYLDEYGADGYDRETFVDFVVCHMFNPGDAARLVDWYRKQADQLERMIPIDVEGVPLRLPVDVPVLRTPGPGRTGSIKP